jgi:hypothetical protein
MTIKICSRCHQAFQAKYDFLKYCEECMSAYDQLEARSVIEDEE